MAGVSHLDEIIDYKKKIINLLGMSQKVVGLLLDNPDIDMTSSAAYDVFTNNLFDYDYVDSTATEAKSYIMVEVETVATSPTMKDVYTHVQIVVPKTTMKLNTTIFRGIKGNRKDNLARQVDLLLNNSDDFCIGKLQLSKVLLATVPETFTSTMLTYIVPDFGRNRKLGNG